MLSATTNTAALTAQRFLGQSSDAASSSIAKMSSGSRIVKASDDASSLAIGNKLRADIAALEQASRNASQGASLLQVASGAMDRVGDILTRLKTLATQVVNGTLSVNERQYAQQEFTQLVGQIDDISAQTRWNNISMLNGGDKGLASTNGLGADRTAGATGLANSAYFTAATAFVAAGASGEISGTIKDVRVTDIGGQYEIQIDIGNQTFVGFSDDAAAIGSEIEFRGQSNPQSSFRLLTSTAAFGTAAQVETALDNLFQLNSTTNPPASFQSAALIEANGAALLDASAAVTTFSDVVKPTGATEDGIYHLTSRANAAGDVTFMLQHESGRTYQASFANGLNANGPQTIIFGNGLEINIAQAQMQAIADGATTPANNLNGLRFEVTAGAATTMNFQVGVKDTDLVTITFLSTTSSSLGLDVLNIETEQGGMRANAAIDEAINRVNRSQAQMGAIQSRMEYVESNLATIIENLSAAKGIFMDVDMAKEMTEFTKHQTLMQAGVAMLAQANQMPQNLLKLIG